MNIPDNADDQNLSEPGRPRLRVLTSTSEMENPPYKTTISQPDAPQASIEAVEARRRGTNLMACVLSWFGILGAGGLYGILIGGNEPIFGFVAGIVIAAVVSVPVIISIAVLAWAFWLSRFQIALTTLTGACTGIASSTPFTFEIYPNAAIPLILIAGCLGGVGGGLAAFMYWSVHTKRLEIRDDDTLGVWQYSLRDLFLRFTVLTILIAAWAAFLAKMID